MNIGKILGSISPGFGLASGKGLFGSNIAQGTLGSMSPLFGMIAGKGLFGGETNAGEGDLGINGLLASLFMKALK